MMSTDLLAKSLVGKSVKRISRKHGDGEVRAAAKAIAEKWSSEVVGARGGDERRRDAAARRGAGGGLDVRRTTTTTTTTIDDRLARNGVHAFSSSSSSSSLRRVVASRAASSRHATNAPTARSPTKALPLRKTASLLRPPPTARVLPAPIAAALTLTDAPLLAAAALTPTTAFAADALLAALLPAALFSAFAAPPPPSAATLKASAATWTFFTARPEMSPTDFSHSGSHETASGVLHAMDFPNGHVAYAYRPFSMPEVVLLRERRAQGEPRRRVREIFVGHDRVRVLRQAVHPVIPDAVAELLLLAPQDALGKVRRVGRVERLAQQILLHARVTFFVLRAHVDDFLLRVRVHRVVAHLLRQQRRADLDAPRHRGLVRAQDVPLMQPRRLPNALSVKLRRVGRLVKVQVPPEQLVRAFAAEDHLKPERLDVPAQQIHRHGRANLLERLEMIDDVRERVERLLRREVHLVMHRAELLRDRARGDEVRRALDADAERVHGLVAAERVGGFLLVSDGDGAAGEQNGVRDVRHETLLDRVHDRLSELGQVRVARGDVLRVRDPLGVVPPRHLALPLAGLADVVVPGGENFVLFDPGVVHERLHLARKPHRAVLAVRDVARDLPHVIPPRDDASGVPVLDDVREHPVELSNKLRPHLLVQVSDHLAVRLVRGDDAVLLAQLRVVVDLPVRDERDLLVRGRKQRLVAVRTGRDDGEPLVHEVRLRIRGGAGDAHRDVHAVRVRSAVTQALREVVHPLAVRERVARQGDDAEDAAHVLFVSEEEARVGRRRLILRAPPRREDERLSSERRRAARRRGRVDARSRVCERWTARGTIVRGRSETDRATRDLSED
eukprot:30943-Pelagococcus_subviridis.AAC.2